MFSSVPITDCSPQIDGTNVIYNERGDRDNATETSITANLRVFGEGSTEGAESMTTMYDSMRKRKLKAQLRRNLENLAIPSTADDVIVRNNQLPSHMQHVLAAMQDKNAEKRTPIADSIHKISPNPRRIFANSTDQVTDPSAQNANVLNEQMAQIQAQISALSLGKTGRGRRRNRSHRKSTFRNQLKQRGVCYYHATFQEHAKKCRFPCTWKMELTARKGDKCDSNHTQIHDVPHYLIMYP